MNVVFLGYDGVVNILMRNWAVYSSAASSKI